MGSGPWLPGARHASLWPPAQHRDHLQGRPCFPNSYRLPVAKVMAWCTSAPQGWGCRWPFGLKMATQSGNARVKGQALATKGDAMLPPFWTFDKKEDNVALWQPPSTKSEHDTKRDWNERGSPFWQHYFTFLFPRAIVTGSYGEWTIWRNNEWVYLCSLEFQLSQYITILSPSLRSTNQTFGH